MYIRYMANSGAVIVVGMIEKGMFYSEYAAMNEEGSTVHGFIEVIHSC